MKYVMWGIGRRGKRCLDVLGKENVLAIIDSDSKLQGRSYEGIPIIGLNRYKEDFACYPIVVTPRSNREIVDSLSREEIYQYFLLTECPPELVSNVGVKWFEYFEIPLEGVEKVIICGSSLYSFLVYDFLKETEYVNLEIVFAANASNQFMNYMMEYYPEYNYCSKLEAAENCLILCTVSDRQKFYSTHGKFIDRFDLSDFIPAYYNPKLTLFKGCHQRKRCFIVATGSSLRLEDLELLHDKNEICMSMNKIFKVFANTDWRPDYYVASDDIIVNEYLSVIENMDVKGKFISDACTVDLPHEEMNIYRYHLHVDDASKDIRFSGDFSRKAYSGATVTYICMQLAVYMGFTEIYLLGVDFDYAGGDITKHFIEDYHEKTDRVNVTNSEMNLRAYQAAKRYCDLNGIKIYNATRGGALEVFERVDFDSLFEF